MMPTSKQSAMMMRMGSRSYQRHSTQKGGQKLEPGYKIAYQAQTLSKQMPAEEPIHVLMQKKQSSKELTKFSSTKVIPNRIEYGALKEIYVLLSALMLSKCHKNQESC